MSYEQCQGTSVSYVGENLPSVNPAINGKVSAWLQSQEPDICAQGTVIFLNTSEMVLKGFKRINICAIFQSLPVVKWS